MNEAITQSKSPEDPSQALSRLAQENRGNPLALDFIQYAQAVSAQTERALMTTGIAGGAIPTVLFINEAMKLPLPAQPVSGALVGTAAGVVTALVGGAMGHFAGARLADRFQTDAVAKLSANLTPHK